MRKLHAEKQHSVVRHAWGSRSSARLPMVSIGVGANRAICRAREELALSLEQERDDDGEEGGERV